MKLLLMITLAASALIANFAQAQTTNNTCTPLEKFYIQGTGANCWYKNLLHPGCPDRSQTCSDISGDAQVQEQKQPDQELLSDDVS